MLSKISALGALGVLALGVSALPVKADTAVIQTTTQDMIVEGSGNEAVQSSEQVNSIRTRQGARHGDDGIVQDSYQVGDVYGNDNSAHQENTQVNVIQRHGGRSHSRSRNHIEQ